MLMLFTAFAKEHRLPIAPLLAQHISETTEDLARISALKSMTVVQALYMSLSMYFISRV